MDVLIFYFIFILLKLTTNKGSKVLKAVLMVSGFGFVFVQFSLFFVVSINRVSHWSSEENTSKNPGDQKVPVKNVRSIKQLLL